MKRTITILLISLILAGCAQQTNYKSRPKAHNKTKEGKKKLKFYNEQYKGNSARPK